MLVFNKDKINYYYNIFLENSSYELTKSNDNKFLSKCYIMMELAFLKELILGRQTN